MGGFTGVDDVYWVRLVLYVALPVALGVAIGRFDATALSRGRRIEALLIPLFVVGICGSGIGGGIAHLLLSDRTADAIGWEAGNPFQHEVGVANLAIGVLGAIAASRRDGFREATVIAVSLFSIGATGVHLVDIVDTGNTAPGNTIQILVNLARPVLLIPLLVASRRAEASTATDREFDAWRAPINGASVLCVIIVSTAFAIGYALDRTVSVSVVGLVLGASAFMMSLRSSRRARL